MQKVKCDSIISLRKDNWNQRSCINSVLIARNVLFFLFKDGWVKVVAAIDRFYSSDFTCINIFLYLSGTTQKLFICFVFVTKWKIPMF